MASWLRINYTPKMTSSANKVEIATFVEIVTVISMNNYNMLYALRITARPREQKKE